MCKKQPSMIVDKIESLRDQYSRYTNDDCRKINTNSKDLDAVEKSIIKEENTSTLLVLQTKYETLNAELLQNQNFLEIDTRIYRILCVIYNYVGYLTRNTDSKTRNKIIAGISEKDLQDAFAGGDRGKVEITVKKIQDHLEKSMKNVAGIDGEIMKGIKRSVYEDKLETVAKIKEEVARRQAQDIPMPDMVQQSDEKKNLYEDN